MGVNQTSQKKIEIFTPVKKIMKFEDIEIPYTLEKRNVKNSRLEFNQGKLIIILSKREKNEFALIKEKQRWILKHYFKINDKLNEIRTWHGKDEMMIMGDMINDGSTITGVDSITSQASVKFDDGREV